MIKIAPSILSANFAYLAEEIRNIQNAGADFIHIDIMDGHFVPNLTIGPRIVSVIRANTNLPLDIHLMIDNPERYLKDYAQAGANYLAVHPEVCPHLHKILSSIHELDKKAGIVLNPHTSLSLIEHVIDLVDIVTIMCVNPGFSGQKFIPSSVEKIAKLYSMIYQHKLKILIAADGGINENTIGICVNAGARIFIAGSAIFNYSLGVVKAIEILRKTALDHIKVKSFLKNNFKN